MKRLISILIIGFTMKMASAEALKGKFIISGWNMIAPESPALGSFKDPEMFKTMKECGFNTICMSPDFLLDDCQKAGIQAWVWDLGANAALLDNPKLSSAEIDKALNGWIDKNKAHPANFGFYIQDEPSAIHFEAIAKVGKKIREYGGKDFYVNLFPNYASPAQLGVSTYRQYVEDFIRICQPRFISYDHYALDESGKLRDGYWSNLMEIYLIAKKQKLPVIPAIQAVAIGANRVPTEEDIMFQVYTHLAHGAKGIQYFTYFTPNYANFRGAPIDQFGDKNPSWYYIRRMNKRLEKLGPALMDLQWVRSYHYGSVPKETNVETGDAESLVLEITNQADGSIVGNVVNQAQGTTEVLISELKDSRGRDFIFVVNKNLKRSICPLLKYKKQPKQVIEIARGFGGEMPFVGENSWVAPAQGVLLRLDY